MAFGKEHPSIRITLASNSARCAQANHGGAVGEDIREPVADCTHARCHRLRRIGGRGGDLEDTPVVGHDVSECPAGVDRYAPRAGRYRRGDLSSSSGSATRLRTIHQRGI